MTKRKTRKRKVNLGSPPSMHAKRVRRLIYDVMHSAEQAQAFAKAGKCGVAQSHYEDAVYQSGELHAHMRSIGRHEYAVSKAARPNLAARAKIAARKVLETHCGREK
jgi:hypothetical protein